MHARAFAHIYTYRCAYIDIYITIMILVSLDSQGNNLVKFTIKFVSPESIVIIIKLVSSVERYDSVYSVFACCCSCAAR